MAAITGGVTTNIMLHDFDGTQTEGDSFGGIVPTQRVKISFDHNKTEYNTAILGGSYTGSFDVNLISFSAFLLNSPPLIGVSLPPPSGQTLTTLLETDSATNRIDSTTFRVEEDWANLNQVKYLVGEYVFQYSDGTNTITDYVRKTVDLNFRTFDTTNIDFERLEDNTGATITEGICDSYTGFLYPIFSSNLTGEYTQGLVTYDTKGGMKEENNHVNTNIAQSDTPIVSGISPVNPINLNDEFQFGVDLSELNPNQSQYCFNTVLIFEGALSTTTCDCIDIELAQTLVTSNAVQNSFDMAFTLSGGITAGEVDNIEFSHNGTITGTYQFNGTLTGTINVILPTSETYSEYTVIINRSNGCNYSKTFSLLPVTVTVDESTCPLYCTICFTSSDPTGSNVIFQGFGGSPTLGTIPGGTYGSGDTQILIDDIAAYLDTNGYDFDHIEVTTAAPGGLINDVCIYATNLPLGVIEILYEDFGVETGVQSRCLTFQEATTCTIQWNGVLVEGNAFLEYSDGTNVGLVGGYTGAQAATLASDLETDALSKGFLVGSVTTGLNGGGYFDYINISNSTIPENYYRIRWATAGASVYGTRSACVTT